mmetsp:Transcript_3569/g.11154  ORF Transcript_3569/g.11154 Transcript_3569/m.11154 type:complete len:333 (+) Transcript_3569:23-1021(+)
MCAMATVSVRKLRDPFAEGLEVAGAHRVEHREDNAAEAPAHLGTPQLLREERGDRARRVPEGPAAERAKNDVLVPRRNRRPEHGADPQRHVLRPCRFQPPTRRAAVGGAARHRGSQHRQLPERWLVLRDACVRPRAPEHAQRRAHECRRQRQRVRFGCDECRVELRDEPAQVLFLGAPATDVAAARDLRVREAEHRHGSGPTSTLIVRIRCRDAAQRQSGSHGVDVHARELGRRRQRLLALLRGGRRLLRLFGVSSVPLGNKGCGVLGTRFQRERGCRRRRQVSCVNHRDVVVDDAAYARRVPFTLGPSGRLRLLHRGVERFRRHVPVLWDR